MEYFHPAVFFLGLNNNAFKGDLTDVSARRILLVQSFVILDKLQSHRETYA